MSARGVFALPWSRNHSVHGQRDGVEHVRADGDHHVHGAALDELLAEFLLGGAGVGGGVGHDEPGAALVVQRGVEELNPEVVGVVGARQAEREAAARADRRPSSRSLSTALTLNGGLARTKSNRPVALCGSS